MDRAPRKRRYLILFPGKARAPSWEGSLLASPTEEEEEREKGFYSTLVWANKCSGMVWGRGSQVDG